PGGAAVTGEADGGSGRLPVRLAGDGLRGPRPVVLAPRRRGRQPGLGGGAGVDDAEDALRWSGVVVRGGLDPPAAHHERAAVPGADAPARPGGGVRAADRHGPAGRAGPGQVEVPAEVPAT